LHTSSLPPLLPGQHSAVLNQVTVTGILTEKTDSVNVPSLTYKKAELSQRWPRDAPYV